jgi:hypothetical protein
MIALTIFSIRIILKEQIKQAIAANPVGGIQNGLITIMMINNTPFFTITKNTYKTGFLAICFLT